MSRAHDAWAKSPRRRNRSLTNFAHTIRSKFSYQYIFDQIIQYTSSLRGGYIPQPEIDGTSILAGPFTTGGLLVLLQEPRADHPWSEGLDSVIGDCPTLESLNEALRIGSQGALDIGNNVSVLDVNQFIPKSHELTTHERIELHDLVFTAVTTKGPDVILCMGDVARLALEEFSHRTSHYFHNVAYCMHPSRSVNHNPNDRLMRKDLLQTICEAILPLVYDTAGLSWIQSILLETVSIHDIARLVDPAAECYYEVDYLTGCLSELLTLSFPENFQDLPSCNISPLSPQQRRRGAKYKMYELQESWLEALESQRPLISTPSTISQEPKMKLAGGLFARLHPTVSIKSWFYPIYDVDWQKVCLVLSTCQSQFHDLGKAMRDTSLNTNLGAGKATENGTCGQLMSAFERLETLISISTAVIVN